MISFLFSSATEAAHAFSAKLSLSLFGCLSSSFWLLNPSPFIGLVGSMCVQGKGSSCAFL